MDISSATLDGADVFVLTHETSIGQNPSGAAVQCAKAIIESERIYDHKQAYQAARSDT